MTGFRSRLLLLATLAAGSEAAAAADEPQPAPAEPVPQANPSVTDASVQPDNSRGTGAARGPGAAGRAAPGGGAFGWRSRRGQRRGSGRFDPLREGIRASAIRAGGAQRCAERELRPSRLRTGNSSRRPSVSSPRSTTSRRGPSLGATAFFRYTNIESGNGIKITSATVGVTGRIGHNFRWGSGSRSGRSSPSAPGEAG